MLSLSFRTARASDATSVAPLLQATMGTLGDYVFGQTNSEGTARFLERMYPEEGHRYSMTFSTLVETGGAVVGLLHAIPGKRLSRCTFALWRAMRRLYGVRAAFGLLRRGWPLAFEPEATGAEYYIECLSVAPTFRNRGVGRSLLAKAERQAAKAGYRICSLGVLFSNEGAKRLYERAGYHVEQKVFTRLRARGVDYRGFYRMVKPLDSAAV